MNTTRQSVIRPAYRGIFEAGDFHYLYSDEQDTDMDTEEDIWLIDSSERFTDQLQGVLDGDFDAADAFPDARTVTFRDSGVLTTNDGLVVRLADGSEYQVTVVRSR